MKNKALLLTELLFCLVLLIGSADGSGLDPDWKRSIVLIEKVVTTPDGEERLEPHSTGFIVWHYGDPSRLILLTAKHVLAGRDSVFLRFNKKNQHIGEDTLATVRQVLHLRDSGKNLWTAHPNSTVDLAGIIVKPDTLADILAIPFSLFKRVSAVTEGEEVLFLGFPLGLTGLKRNYPIVRMGIVALWTDEGIEGENVFLIDAQVFSGNSGSPVFLKPVPIADRDTVEYSTAFFVGIITGHIEAEKRNTILDNRLLLSIKFTENSGLGKVIPAERVVQLLERLWGRKVGEILDD